MSIDLSKIQNNRMNDDDDLLLSSNEDEPIRNKKKQSHAPEPEAFEDKFDDRRIEDLMEQIKNSQPTLKDIQYKNKLIEKILQYKQIFFILLKEIEIKDLDDKQIQELEQLLLKIQYVIKNRNIMSNITNGINLAPSIIEHIATKYTPLKLSGYAGLLNENPEYYYQVQEVLLEHDLYDSIKVSPLNRLAYTLISSALLCHQINSSKESELNMNLKNNDVNENIKKKYSDI